MGPGAMQSHSQAVVPSSNPEKTHVPSGISELLRIPVYLPFFTLIFFFFNKRTCNGYPMPVLPLHIR